LRFDEQFIGATDNFGSPLFLEKQLEEGKVILLTSTIDHEWNAGIQAHPPFLPLMWDLCRYLSSRPSSRRNLFVGDLIHLDLPVEAYQPPFILDTAQEGSVTLPASTPERDQKVFRLFYPSRAKSDDPKAFKNEGVRNAGKYRLLRNSAKEEEKLVTYFAVNVSPRELTPEEIQAAEGNLERISKEEIQRLFPDFKVEFRGEKKEGTSDIDMPPPTASGLWKYLMYFLVGFLCSSRAWPASSEGEAVSRPAERPGSRKRQGGRPPAKLLGIDRVSTPDADWSITWQHMPPAGALPVIIPAILFGIGPCTAGSARTWASGPRIASRSLRSAPLP
jgi:hypothetical protein